MSFEGKSQQEPRNWQMDRILIILKKENGPRASSAPALGLNTIMFKHVYWYMQQTQVSVYRTIGPLVLIFAQKHRLWVIYALSKNKKNIKYFKMKFSIFTPEKILCILHGQIFVMLLSLNGQAVYTVELRAVKMKNNVLIKYSFRLNMFKIMLINCTCMIYFQSKY